LATSKYINQICVIGDRKNFLSALVTIDSDNVKDYAGANGIPFKDINDLINNEIIKKLIEDEIAEKNKEFASFESIKKITIVPEFTIDNGLLTPTMKLKKNVAMDIFKNEIEAMYK
jgi:long-chain acyl-CoA synthetase